MYLSLIALSLMAAAEPQYNLTIFRSNGEKTVIPVTEIDRMEITEADPGCLTDPENPGSSDRNFSDIRPGTPQQPDLTPGFSGSFFAPGVTAEAGFVDADKYGANGPYRDDSADCWMCSAADLVQWWLNDYKAWTGRDFVLSHDLPSPSLYNNIPVMDAMMQAYNATNGGDTYEAVGWFFEGVATNSVMNGVTTFNEAYPYWKGNFGGFGHERLRDIYVVQDETFGYLEPRYMYYSNDPKIKYLDADEMAVEFTRQTIATLQYGPLHVCTAFHALACFGIDYTVDSNGNPVMTRMYMVDNDPVEANVRNGYNMATPHFKDGGVVWISIASAYNGGYDPVTRITKTFGIKSVRFMNCQK